MRKWTMRCVTVALACGLGASLWLNFKMQDRCDRIGRISDVRLEIERRELYAAYRGEEEDFHASHEMMGGGTISHAMLCNARDDHAGAWNSIATNWFFATARDERERQLMRDYGVSTEDLKYSRTELVSVMRGWLTVCSGKGTFEGQNVVFNGGTATFTNKESACSMELKLLKSPIWAYKDNVFVFASSDVAGNGGYGSSDFEYETWFLRFKDGTLADSCHFRHGCGAFDGLRYHFEPENDCIVITSVKTGDIAGELYLGLREYADENGKMHRTFEYSETMVTNRKAVR